MMVPIYGPDGKPALDCGIRRVTEPDGMMVTGLPLAPVVMEVPCPYDQWDLDPATAVDKLYAEDETTVGPGVFRLTCRRADALIAQATFTVLMTAERGDGPPGARLGTLNFSIAENLSAPNGLSYATSAYRLQGAGRSFDPVVSVGNENTIFSRDAAASVPYLRYGLSVVLHMSFVTGARLQSGDYVELTVTLS